MNEFTIHLDDPKATLCVLGEASIEFANENAPLSMTLVDSLRNQIREQLPKAPVEEPTGDVIAFIGGEYWQPDPDTDGQWVGSYDRTHASWRDLATEAWKRSGVDLYRRIAYPESAPSPAEAVEADALDLQSEELQDRLARAIGDPGSVVGRQHHVNETVPRWAMRAVLHVLTGSIPDEPSPMQVEAAKPKWVDLFGIDPNYTEDYKEAVVEAPAEDDPIEALVQEFAPVPVAYGKGVEFDRSRLREFAARVLEVGGQRPGVPVEKVRGVADWLRALQEKSNDRTQWCYKTAADSVAALLPEEPTS